MKAFRRLILSLVLALVCLACCSNAFEVPGRGRSRIHPARVAHQIPTVTPRTDTTRTSRHYNGSSFPLLAKDDQKEDAEKREYAGVVEDGSPLGVAIVLLGSLLVLNGDDSLQAPESPAVLVVFATASVAAGLARLYRYLRDKKE